MTWLLLLAGKRDLLNEGHWPSHVDVVPEGRPLPNSPPAICVVDGRGSAPSEWRPMVARAREAFSSVRVVLLIDFDRSNANASIAARPDVVLWADEIHRLPRVVAEAAVRQLRTALCSLFVGASDDPVVYAAAERAFTDIGRPESVGSLARESFVTEDTLRNRWRQSSLPGTPRVLLDWAVVCALCEGREAGYSLEVVARRLGVAQSTLHRVARRTLGCPPGEVDRERILNGVREWLTSNA